MHRRGKGKVYFYFSFFIPISFLSLDCCRQQPFQVPSNKLPRTQSYTIIKNHNQGIWAQAEQGIEIPDPYSCGGGVCGCIMDPSGPP